MSWTNGRGFIELNSKSGPFLNARSKYRCLPIVKWHLDDGFQFNQTLINTWRMTFMAEFGYFPHIRTFFESSGREFKLLRACQ